MNCPRGLHSKEREIGNTCSQPLEIGIFLLCLLQRVIIIGPIYIEIERKKLWNKSKSTNISTRHSTQVSKNYWTS